MVHLQRRPPQGSNGRPSAISIPTSDPGIGLAWNATSGCAAGTSGVGSGQARAARGPSGSQPTPSKRPRVDAVAVDMQLAALCSPMGRTGFADMPSPAPQVPCDMIDWLLHCIVA